MCYILYDARYAMSSAPGKRLTRGRILRVKAVAREICARARTILGASGILGEYPIMRHTANLESVNTYEGTHEMHMLVIGEAVTGMSAFR